MGRYSKRRSSGRGARRDRERFEQSVDSGFAGRSGRSRRGSSEFLGSTSRIAREAEGAQISNTRLAAAKNLDKVPATLLAERDRRKRRIRKKMLVAVSLFAALLFASVAAGALYYISIHNRMTVRSADIPQALLDTPTPEVSEPFNLVIFGSDARSPSDNDLTDTIIVARIDPNAQRIWMVSIPRDTRVELPGHGVSKINAAYVHGGPEMAIQAVEDVSGQDMDYFMTINFWGFESIIDAMGGIEINVPIAINDPQADFTPDGRASRIAPGLQTLDGAHALTFVRHRDGYQDGDIGRTRAQQLFFRALIEQMADVPLTQMPGIANSLADNVKTNFTPLQLLQLGRSMRGTNPDNFYAITLPGDWRSPFIWIDEAGAAEVWRNFGVAPFESDEEDDGGYEEGIQSSSLSPSEVTLTVRNGTTTVGLAAQASAVLRARGFIVEDIGNTGNQTVYDENMVIFNENRQAAELVAQFMPEATRIVQARGMFHFNTEVLVILGSEWDIGAVPVADVVTSN